MKQTILQLLTAFLGTLGFSLLFGLCRRYLIVASLGGLLSWSVYLLSELWLGDRHDLCVVGDASQTIYSFAGADPRYLLDFGVRHPDARVLRLERNYRSEATVVAVANELPHMLGNIRLVKSAIRVNAVVPVFQQGVTDDPCGIFVVMLPDQRNGPTVIVLEGVFPNSSAIGAQEVVFSGPAAEIEFLFLHPSFSFL